MRNLFILEITAVTLLSVLGGCRKHTGDSREVHVGTLHAGHEDHAAERPETRAAHEREGEAHEEHAAQGSHEDREGEDGVEVSLTPEAMNMAGITLAKARKGCIAGSIDLPGEVGFNEDRLVHITPRFPGIAREVRFKVGESVNEGDVVVVIESNESLSQYPLKAPIAGRIIEKHVSPGEYVSNEKSVYLLADLSTVWVTLAVYPKDASKVRPGQRVSIVAVGSDQMAEGTLQYVTPVMDPRTRRITARVVLSNGGNAWRPGMFVNAHVEIGEGEEGLVVEKAAVQVHNEKNVVFVQHEPGSFKPIEVTVGESDARMAHILDGLREGDEYVNNGAFELKAKIVTGSLSSHAGHNH